MIQTENIELDKYESNDSTNYLVTFNGNMDKIDTAIGDISDNVDTATSTANTALSTANTASTTATTAYTTATGKASIDDLASSTSTTYSSDKIDSLISDITPGTVIDDTTASATTTYSSSKISDIVGAVIDDTSTSLTSTWSSSKINTDISSKASIDDTSTTLDSTWSSSKINTNISSKASIDDNSSSTTTTYSSNKINSLISVPYNGSGYTSTTITLTEVSEEQAGSSSRLTSGYYWLVANVHTSGTGSLYIHIKNSSNVEFYFGEFEEVIRLHKCYTPIFYVPENGYFNVTLHSTTNSFTSLGSCYLYKVN